MASPERLWQRRLATSQDLPRIVDIYNQSIPHRLATADTEPIQVADREAWYEPHVPQTHPLYVLQAAGDVIAWQSFERFYGRPAYRRTAEVSLYVASSHHRQGCGAYLLQQAIADAPRLGLETLLAFISDTIRPVSRCFGATDSSIGVCCRESLGWMITAEISLSWG